MNVLFFIFFSSTQYYRMEDASPHCFEKIEREIRKKWDIVAEAWCNLKVTIGGSSNWQKYVSWERMRDRDDVRTTNRNYTFVLTKKGISWILSLFLALSLILFACCWTLFISVSFFFFFIFRRIIWLTRRSWWTRRSENAWW